MCAVHLLFLYTNVLIDYTLACLIVYSDLGFLSVTCIHIREYGSTLYVGMTREKNGGRIKRVH